MNIVGKGKLLKIFIGESDRWHGEALYHAIIKKIKENGLAGAGFPKNGGKIHFKEIHS